MKQSKKILPSIIMGICVGVFSQVSTAGVLYTDPSLNIDLGAGAYEFAGTHQAGDNILDTFEFSLSDISNLTASIYNYPLPQQQDPSADPLLNIRFLTLGLYDDDGNFIAASGGGGVLNAFGLASGETYTLSVFGQADGIFGGAYYGDVDIVEAPLPAALPAFISALLALGARRRK